MTTDHDAALDGAVRNLAGNVLNAEQVLELIEKWHEAACERGHIRRSMGSGSDKFQAAERRASEAYSAMVQAVIANVRPRP